MVGPPPPPSRFRRQPFDPVDWAARNPQKVAGLVVLALVLGWLLLKGPFYTVEPDEQGLVLTFGKHTATVGPGFHFKWPWPIQDVRTPRVLERKRIEVGFRTIRDGPPPEYEDFRTDPRRYLAEAQMLTGDLNIVNLDLAVQFQIKDAAAYEFNVKDPLGTMRDITEAAIRQAVGDRLIDEALTEGKAEIQAEVMEIVQRVADRYHLGVNVTSVNLQDAQPPEQVEKAFRDVATAKEERSKLENEALAYQNKMVPEAEGEAEKIEKDAEGKKFARVAGAEGEAERFLKLAAEYDKYPEVTRERLLLETLERILPKVEKIVVDEDAGVIHLNRIDLGGAK